MDDSESAVISLDDDQLIEAIKSARKRLLLVVPGLSLGVAQALCERWLEIGRDAVHVLLDIDPEVCRMGYGTIEAIQLLQQTAAQIDSVIHHRPGIRVGILISDDVALVFSPTPLLVEKLPSQVPHPNAIRIDMTSSATSTTGTLHGEANDLIQGGEPVKDTQVQATAQDLSANPPLKFDLARKVRVFNSQIEFVEFELKGLSISRKTVPIPSDLMGLSRDAKTQDLLRSTFKLVGEDSEVSGKRVTQLKQYIVGHFLIVLPGYGTVILRSKKPQFEAAVRTLRRFVARFQKKVRSKLQKEIDGNRTILVNALMPSVCARPPERWMKLLEPAPSRQALQELLDTELKKAFGSADDLFEDMKVKLLFKGVTYESLNDPKFIEIATGAIPSLKFLHEEYDAARASQEQLQMSLLGSRRV